MTAKLTLSAEQRDALKQHPDQPVYIVDAETQATYVLIQAEAFKKVQALVTGGEFNPDEWMPLVHQALKDDIDAPGMEQYDDYDAHRPTA